MQAEEGKETEQQEEGTHTQDGMWRRRRRKRRRRRGRRRMRLVPVSA